MSIPTALWKRWQGRAADGKFPLRQWLGGSEYSAVFLTERAGGSQKAVIKLIPAQSLRQENLDETAQLSRWAGAARPSRPHLIRLFEWGRCQIDDTRLLYIVMEYAEENLAEILPLRPLSVDEASAMLGPTANALALLHQAGFVHGRIKPSNIMAVGEQLKISGDTIRKAGDTDGERPPSAYDAPEVATAGPSPAADIWSLGMTLVAVLTQNEPKLNGPKLKPGERGPLAVPETIPQPLREIIRKCMQVDPQQRCTADEILRQLQTTAARSQPVAGARVPDAKILQARPRRWIVVSIVAAALFLVVLFGLKFRAHQPAVPSAETRAAARPTEIPAAHAPAPFAQNKTPAQKGVVRGSVLQQVMPEVSQSALNTITGRLRVSVQVEVDTSGNVSQAKLVSPGPSTYFANHALAAARRWKFNPPQVDGKAVASEWVLRFQFGRTNIQVFPAETKP